MTRDSRDLPAGWEWRTIAEVTETVKSIDPSKSPKRVFSYVDIASIDNQRQRLTTPKPLLGSEAPSRARRPIRSGDVLFSTVRTYLRNIAPVRDIEQPAFASTGFTLLRPGDQVIQDYLFRYVASDEFLRLVTPLQTGTQYPATSDRVVRSQLIPLPPIEVQRRIATWLDAVDAHCGSAAESLALAERRMASYRQVLLEAACSGRLTAEWREHAGAESSSASADTGRQRMSTSSPLPSLPQTWTWATVGDLGTVKLGGTPSRKVTDYWGGDIPWVSSGEVANCRIARSRETITLAGLANSNAKLYPAGTVLIEV